MFNRLILLILICYINNGLMLVNGYKNHFKVVEYKQEFYEAFGSNDTLKINSQLKLIAAANVIEKKAYTGALLMKKAGFMKTVGQKVNMFKEGKEMLEPAINSNAQNAEYHFLRLAIQEHCPRILGYRDDLIKDAAIVKQSFKQFAPDVKNAIIEYCKTSKVLHSEELLK